jgi:hypothetical protein
MNRPGGILPEIDESSQKRRIRMKFLLLQRLSALDSLLSKDPFPGLIESCDNCDIDLLLLLLSSRSPGLCVPVFSEFLCLMISSLYPQIRQRFKEIQGNAKTPTLGMCFELMYEPAFKILYSWCTRSQLNDNTS